MEKLKKPGRPKKNKTIPMDKFEGEIEEPTVNNAINEIKISEAVVFNQYLKTIKTLKASSLSLYFKPDGFIIESIISVKKKATIYIKKGNVFGYHCSKPCKVQLSSTNSLEELIDSIDENTKFIGIYTTDVNNIIKYYIHDEANDINSESSIGVEPIEYEFETPDLINAKDIKLEIIGYKPNDLKKSLNKKTRKSCNKCKLKAMNNVVTIDYLPEAGKIITLTLNSRNTGKISGQEPNKLYCIELPKTDINQFITHIKDNICISFTDKSIIMRNYINGLELKYFVEI